jgi:hypothetical protein
MCLGKQVTTSINHYLVLFHMKYAFEIKIHEFYLFFIFFIFYFTSFAIKLIDIIHFMT